MVIVLKGSERREHAHHFDQLFRLRHQIFIKQRGWALPSVNSYEIDQYDDDDAVYFLDLDVTGRIRGSVRMTPSVKSSLLADYFPHLVENGVPPRAADIYEATRYIVLPAEKTRQGYREAKTRLLTALLEWCLGKRLRFLQAVVDSTALAGFVEITPRTVPLGLSHPYGGGRGTPGGGECLAFRWPISREVLADIRAYGRRREASPRFTGFGRAVPRQPAEVLH
jgi:acyl-homoserine lactone synthase